MSAQILPFSRDLVEGSETNPEYIAFIVARSAMGQAFLAWLRTKPTTEAAASEANATVSLTSQLLDLTMSPPRSPENPS